MKVRQKLTDPDPRAIPARWNLPAMAGGAAIALGALVVTGWALDAPSLESILAGAIAMQPVTALALILGGGALLASRRPGMPRALAAGLATGVLFLALLDLAQ